MHTSVLLQEVLDNIPIKDGDVIVDGTLGAAGHSSALCEKATQQKTSFTLIGLDRDSEALARSKEKLESCTATKHLLEYNFRDIDKALQEAGITQVNTILLDLGLSSYQLGPSGRGFSFQVDEPLLMTLEINPGPDKMTAGDIINRWAEEDIANVLYAYGEEKFARRIAKKIIAERPIENTKALAELVKTAVPGWYRNRRTHPATKTFQALRIAVNDEFDALTEALNKSLDALVPGGRILVISFHSLEDRIVKHFFRDKENEGIGTRITKRAIKPSEEEITTNPRSRSALLRIFEKN